MLASYRQHVAERAALGIPPLPLTPQQTAEVIDGPQSVVFDEAENRMHMHKALMLLLLREAGTIQG